MAEEYGRFTRTVETINAMLDKLEELPTADELQAGSGGQIEITDEQRAALNSGITAQKVNDFTERITALEEGGAGSAQNQWIIMSQAEYAALDTSPYPVGTVFAIYST